MSRKSKSGYDVLVGKPQSRRVVVGAEPSASSSAMATLTAMNPFTNWNTDKTVQSVLGVGSIAMAVLAYYKPKTQVPATVAGVALLGGSWFYPELHAYAVSKTSA